MKFEKVVASALSIPESSFADSTELRSISSWDSMTHMLLISRLEEEYSVQFTGDEIADMRTIGDARRLLRGHGASI